MAALALAAVASLSLAAAAPAKARDRNHDRIPDRWEKRHELSLKVKQARRDQDDDGLTNLGEYRAGLHPRDPDTDGDGIEDGDENAGRIVSFEGGVLTISLAGGGQLSARVGEDTRVKCACDDEDGDEAEKPDGPKPESDDDAAHKTSTPNRGEDEPVEAEKPDEDAGEPEGEHGDGEHGDEEKDESSDDHAGKECGLDDLVAGAKVGEAQLALHRGRLYWTKLELR
jgi:hypothetical protein